MSIRNVRHHGLTQEEIREAGYDTNSLVTRRFEEAMRYSEPRVWNTGVKRWGEMWSTVECSMGYIEVEIGLSGCMQGIVVAKFDNRAYARHFADDFIDHKVFCLTGNEEWCAYVREAHARRSFDSDKYIALIALGRTEGIQLSDGQPVKQHHLQALYARGERV